MRKHKAAKNPIDSFVLNSIPVLIDQREIFFPKGVSFLACLSSIRRDMRPLNINCLSATISAYSHGLGPLSYLLDQ